MAFENTLDINVVKCFRNPKRCQMLPESPHGVSILWGPRGSGRRRGGGNSRECVSGMSVCQGQGYCRGRGRGRDAACPISTG